MKNSMRPNEEEGEPLTVFVPAVPASAEQNLISSMALQGGGNCQLELDVASLVFCHHHLFSLEHYMTRSVEFMNCNLPHLILPGG